MSETTKAEKTAFIAGYLAACYQRDGDEIRKPIELSKAYQHVTQLEKLGHDFEKVLYENIWELYGS